MAEVKSINAAVSLLIAEPGDSWIYRAGVRHYHETPEDSVQLEVKSPPRKPWR